MKLKNSKLFLCGLLAVLLLARNIEDGQFALSFFFSIVSWQCLRAAVEVKGFEDGDNRQAAFQNAARKFYGPLAGVAWMLPYAALALCAVVGVLKADLKMPMVWTFIAVVMIHSVCEMLVWKKAVREK